MEIKKRGFNRGICILSISPPEGANGQQFHINAWCANEVGYQNRRREIFYIIVSICNIMLVSYGFCFYTV